MKNLILLTLTLVIVSSCSVEKRLYNKGYNVQWRKSKISNLTKVESEPFLSKNKQNVDLADIESTKNVTYQHIENVEGVVEPVNLIVEPYIENKNSESQNLKQVVSESFDRPYQELGYLGEVEQKPKREGLALASLILGILAFPILSIIFGLVQLKRIKNDPTLYGGTNMAMAGVILGVLYILIASAVLAFMFGAFFLSILLVVSVALSVVGIIQLIRRSNDGANHFGILFTIFGWLGLMFTTLLVFP